MAMGKIHFVKSSKLNRLDVWATDPNADPRLSSPESVGVREIAAWLSDDVNSRLSAVGWIERLEALESAGAKAYLGTGNAHHVGVINEYIFLEYEFVDDFKVLMHTKNVISVLRFYVGAHEGYAANVCFDVEYEMEGEQALNRYLELGGRLGLTDTEIAENTRKVKLSRKKKADKHQQR